MRHPSLLLHALTEHDQCCLLLEFPIMSSIRTPLNSIAPLYRERCIAFSPDGGVCPGRLDVNATERGFAQTELSLSKESNPANRAINFRNAARRMICGNHRNRMEEVRRVARLWEEEAAQQSNATMHPLFNTEISSYNQSPKTHTVVGSSIEDSPRRPAVV
jgi:hypothetical protein